MLKEIAMKISDYEEKEMIPLTKKENKLYREQEKCHICKRSFAQIKMMKIILIEKRLEIIVIIQENLEELPIVKAV